MLSRHAPTLGSKRERPAFERPTPHVDPSRVLGVSGALAFNLVMLLVLVVPLSRPPNAPLPDPQLVFDWITPRPVPPDPPPVEVEIVQPHPRSTAAVRPAMAQDATTSPVVDHGSLPADPAPVSTSGTETIEPPDSGLATAGAGLQYLHAPEPRYPRDALLAGLEGIVILHVLVGRDGRALQVRVHQSSGHRVLDDAARRQVLRHWHFRAAIQDGQAVQAVGLVPVEFRMAR